MEDADRFQRLRQAIDCLIMAYDAGAEFDLASWTTTDSKDVLEWRVDLPSGFVKEYKPQVPDADKVMALSVIVGDPNTLPQALADYMIDHGHEYATAAYEKGKADERARCVAICEEKYNQSESVLDTYGGDSQPGRQMAAKMSKAIEIKTAILAPPIAAY